MPTVRRLLNSTNSPFIRELVTIDLPQQFLPFPLPQGYRLLKLLNQLPAVILFSHHTLRLWRHHRRLRSQHEILGSRHRPIVQGVATRRSGCTDGGGTFAPFVFGSRRVRYFAFGTFRMCGGDCRLWGVQLRRAGDLVDRRELLKFGVAVAQEHLETISNNCDTTYFIQFYQNNSNEAKKPFWNLLPL